MLLAGGLVLLKRRVAPGATALLVALGYLIGRSLLDLLRAVAADGVGGADPRLLGNITLTQGVALGAVPILLVLLAAVLLRRGNSRAPRLQTGS